MRTFSRAVFFLCATALFAQQAAPPKPALVDGKVVNSVSGEAVRKVELTFTTSLVSDDMENAMAMFGALQGDQPKPAAAKAEKKTFSAVTDAAGKFHLEIEPGEYFLHAKHAGFVDQQYKPEGKFAHEGKVHLTADEPAQVAIRLVPQGAVSGRVVDEDGDPVPGAMVSAQRYSYDGGHRRLFPADSSAANDRGEFRLGKLAPGRYYLSADVMNMDMMGQAPPPPADGSPETGYVTSYYPRTTDAGLAAAIDVAAGADLPGYQIQVQKARVARVQGQLIGPDGAPIKSAQVMLMSGAHMGSMKMRMVNDPQGRFEIAGVQPGNYTAMVVQMAGASPSMRMQPLVVPADGLKGVQLGAQREGTVTGTVTVLGDGKIERKNLRIMIAGGEAMPSMPVSGAVSESGAFTLEKVGAAEYELSLNNVPAGAYLKSVQWAGRERLGQSLDFSGGFAGALQIVLGTDGGAVEVSVTHDDKPAADATVVLLSTDPDRRFEQTTENGETDSTGLATFHDVPPGSYLAFAWDHVEEGAWFDPAFLKPYENQAASVKIEAKGHEKLQLKLISAR